MLSTTNLRSLEKNIWALLRVVIDKTKSKSWKRSSSPRILKTFAKRKIIADRIDIKNGIYTLNEK